MLIIPHLQQQGLYLGVGTSLSRIILSRLIFIFILSGLIHLSDFSALGSWCPPLVPMCVFLGSTSHMRTCW